MKHFTDSHSRSSDGRFITPLPKRASVPNIGESRSRAVKRFLSLERSLHNNRFSEFAKVIEEYFSLEHAEEVPALDLQNHRSPFSTCLCTQCTSTRAQQLRSESSSMLQ